MKIAGLQTAGTPGDVEANLRELDAACRQARAEGADLLVTTELFLTGYDIGDTVQDLAHTDLLSPAQQIARHHAIALVLGAPEYDCGAYYNSAFFIDPAGAVLGRHRKTHLFGELDRRYFTPGDRSSPVVDYAGARIAMLICYDVEFPENVRAAAVAGADLIAVPTAQMQPYEFIAEHLLRVRAWENQVYIAYINHDGDEGSLRYVGRSSIVGPSADVLDSVEHGNQLIFATVDPAAVREARKTNPYLADRRPELQAPAPTSTAPLTEDRTC
ncbi:MULTISPECIES: carbon-nitrogen hydrolase family protein [unclassified Streptomyces]|uniref:carbon-nitrogen hydrolase family protein n=1 Tax=unclassified Streptomyces TaxID=2593676 RepID=UPI002E3185B1|nr:carbon-nitrogen hydrolase family protein [Streptomyces sp. NBC_01261]WSX55609.1 carbon-nitrogen hydrolase family protein [Streptomyces sp. NBC_00986]